MKETVAFRDSRLDLYLTLEDILKPGPVVIFGAYFTKSMSCIYSEAGVVHEDEPITVEGYQLVYMEIHKIFSTDRNNGRLKKIQGFSQRFWKT